MSHTPSLPEIRLATPQDAEALANIGARTFSDTFAADNTPEDLALFLDATYGEAQQRAELADPRLTYLVAERDGVVAGFALLRRGKEAPGVTDPTAVELQRLYVERAWHGSGLGKALMAACQQAARDEGAAVLWLGVWERNAKALRFYAAQGFEAVGSQTFTLGTDPQVDIVMQRRLTD
ncbi:MAG: GNAT family N-acetyltransferase [Gemmatimonadota bacterium]